jgi:hypothetical protein
MHGELRLKIVVDNIKTHFMFNYFFSENLAVYEKVWKNMVEPDGPQMTTYGVWALHAG